MKKYDQENFNRYRNDLKSSQPDGKFYDEYTRDELIIKFMPLVENLARKFSTSEQASGVMTVVDMIQEGSVGLIKAVDKIIWPTIFEAEDPEKRLKSFLAKRVKGAIRRAIDNNRGSMRIPEHKLNEIRKNFDDENNSTLFFNSMFDSIDYQLDDENSYLYQIEDKSEDPLRKEKLHGIIRDVMLKHLSEKEYHVLRLSYGLGCDRLSAKQIAKKLNMQGTSSYVRVSQLKKQAIEKLKTVLKHSQVVDYL